MMMKPSAVSLRITTSCAMITGSMARIAWGNRIMVMTEVLRRPRAAAASHWPRGRARIPERIASARIVPLYRVNAVTTDVKVVNFSPRVGIP